VRRLAGPSTKRPVGLYAVKVVTHFPVSPPGLREAKGGLMKWSYFFLPPACAKRMQWCLGGDFKFFARQE